VVGVTALAVSAGGAVSVSQTDLLDPVSQDRGAGALAAGSIGTATPTSALARRGAVVSRDSRRDALAEKADEKLVEQAEAQAEQRNAALEQFAAAAEKQAEKIELNQWVLPLTSYRLSAFFGASSYLWSSVHTGLDMSAPSGTPIQSVANGVVTETGYDGSYGNKTVVTLDDGTEIWYCHQTSFLTSVGDSVRGGEVIGTVGSTGNSTGPHLHIEVRPGGGDPVDPYSAFLEHGLNP
jgi:murein DD-endopeptidase MepM/ murein hydrolase activator NlpD